MIRSPLHTNRLRHRLALDRTARLLAGLAVLVVLGVLVFLIGDLVRTGAPWLDWQFLTGLPSRHPEQAGIGVALVGTIWVAVLVALVCFPVGIGAAVWLEEYARPGRFKSFIDVNIANLAGVPSILFGLLGLTVFSSWLGLGRSVLAGALTLALLVLPMVILTSQEALRSVPISYRLGAFALGATRWQTISRIVLPAALPGILTGTIFAIARAIGEAAPMIAIAALVYLTAIPTSPLDRFTVLPIQLFNWISRPQAEFQGLAAAGILVLLALLVLLNSAAIWLRARSRQQQVGQ